MKTTNEELTEWTDSETVMFLILLPVLLPLEAVTGGYVLSQVWKWFIVPPFGVEALTIGQAIGINTVIALLKVRPMEKKQLPFRQWLERLLTWILIGNLVYLGLAYVTYMVIR
jgi:hypothetical protein